ncbi:MAG: hypothetical protein Q8N51_10710 [Gammaproteobacteria bacterium]|nr:hypothetical protein [Gammaproteobacteria bacterium]
MHTITPSDIVAALSDCDQRQLARALASCPDREFQHLAGAVLEAAELKAAYPRSSVIAEADALLYDVLRWPMSDGITADTAISAAAFARLRGVTIDEAQRTIQYVESTDSWACDLLLDSDLNPNFTLEQSQVLDCIVELRGKELVPTRTLLREYATRIAMDAMQGDNKSAPVIYSDDPTLGPRIASPSPKVHAILWLDRMDANPPQVGLMKGRIANIADAKTAMGNEARRVEMLKRAPTTTSPAYSEQSIASNNSIQLAG